MLGGSAETGVGSVTLVEGVVIGRKEGMEGCRGRGGTAGGEDACCCSGRGLDGRTAGLACGRRAVGAADLDCSSSKADRMPAGPPGGRGSSRVE